MFLFQDGIQDPRRTAMEIPLGQTNTLDLQWYYHYNSSVQLYRNGNFKNVLCHSWKMQWKVSAKTAFYGISDKN